jgi:hypothetical protein
MSSRSRAAANLAYHLNDKVGASPVRASWEQPVPAARPQCPAGRMDRQTYSPAHRT